MGGWIEDVKKGKYSKVMRDLPFIDSIFWAFKVFRKGWSVKKLLKCEFQDVFTIFSHHSSAWEMS